MKELFKMLFVLTVVFGMSGISAVTKSSGYPSLTQTIIPSSTIVDTTLVPKIKDLATVALEIIDERDYWKSEAVKWKRIANSYKNIYGKKKRFKKLKTAL